MRTTVQERNSYPTAEQRRSTRKEHGTTRDPAETAADGHPVDSHSTTHFLHCSAGLEPSPHSLQPSLCRETHPSHSFKLFSYAALCSSGSLRRAHPKDRPLDASGLAEQPALASLWVYTYPCIVGKQETQKNKTR
ncbi:hypothetical protein XA68_15801 [Ophiocordyceps unilateralis]|uniref:Uncharacterized protein n=1 Tax=Ophiocordyceps unilateralis TaxID=268505 RepID=A0A2A9PKN8_OPHUN|nr:hypothetical protein XA68_15801 [Ophiocordyceps unilateralis]